MDRHSPHDLQCYRSMLRALEGFQAGQVNVGTLAADLDSLARQLVGAPDEWHDLFDIHRDTLDFFSGLEMENIGEEGRSQVNKAVGKLIALVKTGMSKHTPFDLAMYRVMLRALEDFKASRITIGRLVNDLELRCDSVVGPSQEWLDMFHRLWSVLEMTAIMLIAPDDIQYELKDLAEEALAKMNVAIDELTAMVSTALQE